MFAKFDNLINEQPMLYYLKILLIIIIFDYIKTCLLYNLKNKFLMVFFFFLWLQCFTLPSLAEYFVLILKAIFGSSQCHHKQDNTKRIKYIIYYYLLSSQNWFVGFYFLCTHSVPKKVFAAMSKNVPVNTIY